MDIQKYYEKSAKISFYAAMISLIIAILFFVLHISGVMAGKILWLTLPFILLSMNYYIRFRLYEKHMRDSQVYIQSKSMQLFDSEHLLLAFLPAPSLRMQFFNKDGAVVGEIRDQDMSWYKWLLPNVVSMFMPKRFGLYDCLGNRLAEFQTGSGLWSNMIVKDHEGNEIGRYKENAKVAFLKTTGMISKPDGTEWIPINIGGLSSFHLKVDNGKKLASFQTGWMPREWGKLFKNPNMPILTFHEKADLEGKLVTFGLLSALFHHVSN
ncbi:hypothetical protein [Bacillus cihuensis]|uniref:hypothetical protein n=1 Tax=Bacillus cihuensis TaxID=1208599 RepID=UPI000405EDEF|nr:hypothetical protein [Bacillus cihuensis]